MRSETVIVTVFALALAAPIIAAAQLPVVVEHTEVIPADPESGRPTQIAVRVHNRGKRTVNAWGVIAHVKFLTGEVRMARTATDGYEAGFRELRDNPALSADGRYTIKIDAPRGRTGSPIIDVSAEPWFVVFDDDTAAGDESEIAFIFQQRALHRRTWQVIERIVLDASAKITDPTATLRDIDAGLAGIVDTAILNSGLVDGVKQRVAASLRPGNSQDTKVSLQRLISEVQTRRRAAEARWQRR